jgi:hypothetical protein
MSEVSNQLDYKKETYIHPSYRLNKILPQAGSQSVTINTGGNDTMFEIPVKAFNLARSLLCFNIEPAANGAAYYYAYKDVFTPIRQMQLYTRSGIYLCDLNELPNFTKVTLKPETRFEEYITYDSFVNAGAGAYNGAGRYLTPINTIAAANQRPQDSSAVSRSYTEPQYIEVGTNTSQSPAYQIVYPLGTLKNTIYALDKDIYANEILILRIIWNQANRIIYNGTNNGNPSTAVTVFAGSMNITNLTLYLAVETNQEIVNQLRTQVASGGVNILIPYVYTYKTNLGPSASQTVSLRFNRGHGIRLCKIYHSVFNNNETVSTGRDNAAGNPFTIASAYDNDNRAVIAGGVNALTDRSKVRVFYTMLDNERIQEFNLTCANNDDYMMLKDKLKGSVIASSDMFYYNWFWLEDFTGISDKSKEPENKDNLEVGLDLSVERKWDFYGQQMNNTVATAANILNSTIVANTSNGQYNHYSFAITQKMLTISPSGITVI